MKSFLANSLPILAVVAVGLGAVRTSERLRSTRAEVASLEKLALRAAERDRVAGLAVPSVGLETLEGNEVQAARALRDEGVWIIDGERCVGCLDRVRRDQLSFRDEEPVLVVSGVPSNVGLNKLREAGVTVRRILFDPARKIAGSLGLDFPSIQMLTSADGHIRDVDLRISVAACNWSFIANHVNHELEVDDVSQ